MEWELCTTQVQRGEAGVLPIEAEEEEEKERENRHRQQHRRHLLR